MLMAIARPTAILALAGTLIAGVAAAAPNSGRNGCSPGTDCWTRRVITEQQYLDDLQRARELRRQNLNRGRELRSQSYPGYRDNAIPTFRPRGIQRSPFAPILVDPLRR